MLMLVRSDAILNGVEIVIKPIPHMTIYFLLFQGLLMAFVSEHFDQIINTQHSLQLAKRFEDLAIPGLDMEEQYRRLLEHYTTDLEAVANIYQKTKAHPEVARDLPPVAGTSISPAEFIFLWVINILDTISLVY
jgi:Dynein heavy chain, N-terminal region 1